MHLLGTSGTVTTIAGVYLGLKRYDRRRVDGCWMSADEINGDAERLLSMYYESRVGKPASAPSAPIWCWPAARFWKRSAGPSRASACASPIAGLREGMLVQMMREDGVWDAVGAAVS